MIPLAEAHQVVLAGCVPLAPGFVDRTELVGCVLADAVGVPQDVPPFDNSAMDGFAVRSEDTTSATAETPVALRVVDTVLAGQAPSRAVASGEAVRIMTGAPVPDGADAIVPVELVRTPDGVPTPQTDTVLVSAPATAAQHVRRRGDDLSAGTSVFGPGTCVGPGHLGVLASLGVASVLAHRRPRVGVCSTGDELVEGPGPLAPGQIRDSNRPTLLALVAANGWDPVDLGSVGDDATAIEAALRDGVERCDAILSSGGVSMGDVDLVKVVLDAVGEMRWMQVAIRPAKPLAFGVVRRADGHPVPVFGLPGNPVSSMVSFELFARPGIRRLAGHPDDRLHRPHRRAVAAEAIRRRADGKVHIVRVRTAVADGQVQVTPLAGQGSHQLLAMAEADALAIVPDGSGVAAGEPVDIIEMDR